MAGRFKDYVYNPLFLADKYEEDIGTINRAAIRADYSAMRKVAMKRLKRFEGTQWAKSQIYKNNKNRFKKLDEIKDPEELAHLLVDLRNFLKNPLSTVSGQKRNIKPVLEALHERGFTFVNANNFSDFAIFMDRMRALGLSRIYDSEQTAEIWNNAGKQGVSPAEVAEAFNKFTKNQTNTSPGGLRDAVSSDTIVEIWRKARKV